MAKRVNFLEKGAYVLTYRNMLVWIGVACLVCLFIYGIFAIRFSLLKNKLESSKRIVQELSLRKDKILAVVRATQSEQAASTAIQALSSFFTNMPTWSAVLGDLSNTLPSQLWLTNLRSESGDSSTRKLELAGRGISAGSIAQFVKQLEDSSIFQNATLVNSRRTDKGSDFNFVINAEIVFPHTE